MLRLLLLGVLLVLAPASARAQAASPDSIVLQWTAPSDPGAGAVSRYEIRYSTGPVTPANFPTGFLIDSPAPGAPGTIEHVVVRGLAAGHSYWFAIRSSDSAGNWSDLSNVLRWDDPLDASTPASPAGLLVSVLPAGGVGLSWSAGAEPDLAGYHVWRAIDSYSTWYSLTPGLVHDTTFVDHAPPPGASKVQYAVSAVNAAGIESARSAPVTVVLPAVEVSRPLAWKLAAAYPNPARVREVVHLPVAVPATGSARIEIVDVANQVVRRFALESGASISTRVDWDGTNDRGATCAPGVYCAWLVSGSDRQFVRIARVP